MSPFLVLCVSGGCFHFYSILHRNYCTQTVQTLIRCHIWRHLNWICTVCITHQNGCLVLKGLQPNFWFIQLCTCTIIASLNDTLNLIMNTNFHSKSCNAAHDNIDISGYPLHQFIIKKSLKQKKYHLLLYSIKSMKLKN